MKKLLFGCVLIFILSCGRQNKSSSPSAPDEDQIEQKVEPGSFPMDTVLLEDTVPNALIGLLGQNEKFFPCPDPGYSSMVPETFALLDDQLDVDAFRRISVVFAVNAGWEVPEEISCFRLYQLHFPDERTAATAAKAAEEIWERGVGYKLTMEWSWIQKGKTLFWIDGLMFRKESETMEHVEEALRIALEE